MFHTLSQKLHKTIESIQKKSKLSEKEVDDFLKDVRFSLLEADVSLSVVKTFLEYAKQKTLDQNKIQGVTSGELIAKNIHDALVHILSHDSHEINLSAPSPIIYLVCGLQGAGKTTTAAKLALKLKTMHKKNVLLVSLDVHRPGAQQQLEILAQECHIDSLPIISQELPLEILHRALKESRLKGYDIVLLDTAGRLHVDTLLMHELKDIHQQSKPLETLFVADAMTGQDAVHSAKVFSDLLPLTGIILTRVDGDTRGGAALSMTLLTQCPIKFLGTGETMNTLEAFRPESIANRLLGLGDIASFVEQAMQTMDTQETEISIQRLIKGLFTLDDYLCQIRQLQKIGDMKGFMSLIPGFAKMKKQIENMTVDSQMFKRHEAIILSMTPQERKLPVMLKNSRKKRIAQGSGTTIVEINKLLKQYEKAETAIKSMKKQGLSSLLGGGSLPSTPSQKEDNALDQQKIIHMLENLTHKKSSAGRNSSKFPLAETKKNK